MAGFPLRRFLVVSYKLGPTLLSFAIFRKRHRGQEITASQSRKLSRQARTLYDGLVSLGPAFIKLGQILSVRPDILPPEYIRELEKLQDDVPAADFSEVRRIIEEDLGPIGKVFERFEETPIASASLGQVYLARLRGMDVAVKVNRPKVRELVEQDARILNVLIKPLGLFVDSNIEYTFRAVIREYLRHVKEEIDYLHELRNMEKIRSVVDSSKVVVPVPVKEVSTNRVLVMSYNPGVKIGDLREIDRLGLDRPKLSRRLSRTFLTMLLEEEIFHADPHPGNIAVASDGKLILYDYGMTGSLDEVTRKNLVRMYAAFSMRDPAAIADALLDLGALDPEADRDVVEQGFELMLRELKGETVSEWEFQRLMELSNSVFYRFPFKLPDELVLYLRMATLLEGVCTKLDPEYSFLKSVTSILEEKGYVDQVRKDALRTFVSQTLNNLIAFNRSFPRILKHLEGPRDSRKAGNLSRYLTLSAVVVIGATGYLFYEKSSFAFAGLLLTILIVLAQTLSK